MRDWRASRERGATAARADWERSIASAAGSAAPAGAWRVRSSQAVGAVDAGAGALAAGVEAGDVGLSPDVGADAAHGVVGGGGDRDGLTGDVQAVIQAGAVYLGEVSGDAGVVQVGDVQEDVVGGGLVHAVEDGAGDDVAGGELGPVVVFGHEAGAVAVQEDAALAADGLGD